MDRLTDYRRMLRANRLPQRSRAECDGRSSVILRGAKRHYAVVMPGLDPGIHDLLSHSTKNVDGRVKPGHDEDSGCVVREDRYFAAITMISTLYWGAASLASTVARAGVLPADTQPSHTAFISGNVFMSVM